MTTFTVLRDQTTIEDSTFNVAPLKDTANPFGDYAVAKLDDRGGSLFNQYERGTRIDISIDPDDGTVTIQSGETITTDSGTTDSYTTINNKGTYENQGTVEATTGTVDGRFTGYVVEPRGSEQSGADVLEVEAYSFDQFLRRNNVSSDQTGNTISEALDDIITNDTPVSFVSGNIDVGDEQELTRSYRGRPVEQALRDFAFKSNNEEFGVNDDLEFFFRPQESTHIDRGVDDTQWFNYDIPERGKEAINEVEVWFDDGDRSVVIDDSTDKLDLQDSLELPEPGTQRAELNRPLITDISDAEDVGRKYLKFRNATLSGTVTTFGLFDAEPGDTIDVEITPRGIDEEFVIAAVEYRWGRDQTRLTIVENRGDVDDILTEINDSVQRQEMSGANRDADSNRITTTNATSIVSVSSTVEVENTDVLSVSSGETLTVDSGSTETASSVENAGTLSNQGTVAVQDSSAVSADADRLVNPGRRAVRDAWTGDSPPDVTTLVLGSDNSGLSRSNTALSSQTDSVSVTQSLPDSTTVQFDASNVTDDGVEELGLEAADGTLITRLTFTDPVDLDGDVSVTLAVSNDDSVSRGVLTNDGQTAVRDVLADNSPAVPTDYGYGSDDAALAETDTALGSEVVDVSLVNVVVQSADSQSEWESILGTIPDDVPLTVDSTGPVLQQSCFTTEAENNTSESGMVITSDADASGGEARSFDGDGSSEITFDFTPQYTIPKENFTFFIRYSTLGGNDPPETTWSLDGEDLVDTSVSTGSAYQHDDAKATFNGFSEPSSDVDGGTTHTLKGRETTSGTDGWVVDVIAPADNRFSYTLDNDNGGSSGFLDGPELFPDLVERQLSTATTQRNVTEASFELTANDVSNNFYVELANDGSNFTRVSNSQTGSVTFADANRDVDSRIGFSRFGSRTSATPQQGFNAQQVDDWELTVTPDAVRSDDIGETLSRAIVPPGTITGDTVREAGLKAGSTLLSRHVLAEFTVEAGERLSSAEATLFTSDN